MSRPKRSEFQHSSEFIQIPLSTRSLSTNPHQSTKTLHSESRIGAVVVDKLANELAATAIADDRASFPSCQMYERIASCRRRRIGI